jgi:DNA-binding NarL/FixJ family response regulator
MTLLLVDDDPQLATLIAQFLGVERPDWIVRVAGDGHEALRTLGQEPVDIMVVDIQMPGMDGLSLMAKVRADPVLAHLPMILATGRVDRASVRGGMTAGADDYLTKPYTVEELIAAIEARMRLRDMRTAGDEMAATLQNVKNTLTEREIDVLGLIGRGLVTKDIARFLDLSPATVSVHRANIMRKLGLHNSAALAALAVRIKLS